jgi:hypothetical protein
VIEAGWFGRFLLGPPTFGLALAISVLTTFGPLILIRLLHSPRASGGSPGGRRLASLRSRTEITALLPAQPEVLRLAETGLPRGALEAEAAQGPRELRDLSPDAFEVRLGES